MNVNKEKRNVRTRLLLSAVMIVFLVCVVFVYYRMLVNKTRNEIVNNGRFISIEQAGRIENHMSASLDTLKLAGHTVDNMIKTGCTQDEIQDYLVSETQIVEGSLLKNTTGIYGYIRGEYMDGSGWVPDEGYDPTQRPWYVEAREGDGKIIIVDPYVDLDTGEVMIALAYTLSDKNSVIGIDISLDELQDLITTHKEQSGSHAEFVINGKGKIVAHSDSRLAGRSLGDGSDYLTDSIGRRLSLLSDNYLYLNENGKDYMIYVMPIENDWTCVSVIDATDEFSALKTPLVITLFVILIIIGMFGAFTIGIIKKSREVSHSTMVSRQAVEANEEMVSFLMGASRRFEVPVNTILEANEEKKSVSGAALTLRDISDDIIAYLQMENGKLETVSEEYELSQLIGEIAGMIKTRAGEKGLDTELDIDRELPAILSGDTDKIRHAITNMIAYVAEKTIKGSVSFSASGTKIASVPDHMILCFSVTGTCAKAEEEEPGKENKGAGLGLIMAEKLLEMMGTSLDREFIEGEGLTLRFGIEQQIISNESLKDYDKSIRSRRTRGVRKDSDPDIEDGTIADSERIALIDSIRKAAYMMDCNSLDEAVSKLIIKCGGASKNELADHIADAASRYDYDEVLRLCNGK